MAKTQQLELATGEDPREVMRERCLASPGPQAPPIAVPETSEKAVDKCIVLRPRRLKN